jgi:hypothetical protein
MSAEVNALLTASDFDGALRIVEEGLRTYPGEGSLERLNASALSAKAVWERNQAVQAVLRHCAQLGSETRFAEAIQAAEAALREFGHEPLLADAIRLLEKAWERHSREEALRSVLEEADGWLERAYPDRAIPVLQEGLTRYPGEARLLELLARAQEERKLAVAAVSRDAARHCERLAFHEALDVLEQGLARFPEETKLAQQLEALKNAGAVWRRNRTIQDVVAQATAWARENHYAEALQLLANCRREYQDDAVLRQAQQRIEAAWREFNWHEAVLKTAAAARLSMEQGHVSRAVQLLREATAHYPNEQVLVELLAVALQEMERRQKAADIAAAQSDAQLLMLLRDYEGALAAVARQLQKWPSEPILLALLDEIRTERDIWQRA